MATTYSNSEDTGKLILRVSLGVMILLHGIAKIVGGVDGIVGTVAKTGLPGAFGYLVYVGEVLAPLLLIVGVWTRLAALVVAINMVVAIALVHMGDLFFNGSFPFVDLKSGGTVAGYLDAQKAVLGWMPPDARVIPGHGALATPADLRAINDALAATVKIVRDAAAAGKTLDQIVAQGLGAEYAKLATGFIKEDIWIRTVHASYFGAPP